MSDMDDGDGWRATYSIGDNILEDIAGIVVGKRVADGVDLALDTDFAARRRIVDLKFVALALVLGVG